MPPLGRPVSHALAVAHGLLEPDLRDVLRAVDAVHGDGDLPRIPLMWAALDGREGIYRFEVDSGAATRIVIEQAGRHRHLAAAHEIGHFLDHQAIGWPGRFASAAHRLLRPWRRAVRSSRAFAALAALEGKRVVEVESAEGETVPVEVQTAVVRYLGTFEELWARAYAQFIASRSRQPALLADLDARRLRRQGAIYYHQQWDDDDFAPIQVEIERLFRSLEWLV